MTMKTKIDNFFEYEKLESGSYSLTVITNGETVKRLELLYKEGSFSISDFEYLIWDRMDKLFGDVKIDWKGEEKSTGEDEVSFTMGELYFTEDGLVFDFDKNITLKSNDDELSDFPF